LHNALTSLAGRRGVRQFVKFGIVGTSGFLVNLVAFTLLQRVVPDHAKPLQYDLIYSAAFLAGGVSNYYLNRIWTFRSTGHAVREGAQFLSV
jgi:putative flippase GtrA